MEQNIVKSNIGDITYKSELIPTPIGNLHVVNMPIGVGINSRIDLLDTNRVRKSSVH